MLVHSSSGACDCVWVYCSGSMCVGVTVWFGWGGVVSLCRLRQCFSLHNDITPPQPNHTVTPTHIEPEQHTQPHSRKLLKMNVLAFKTCWAKNKSSDISWSIFIQMLRCCILSFGWFLASKFCMLTFRNILFHRYGRCKLLTPPLKVGQNVPKRRRTKFRRRRIIQKKEHNIQNSAKVWNQRVLRYLSHCKQQTFPAN
jgi:hypothetical protein